MRGFWATQPGPRQEPPPLGAQQHPCVSHVCRAAGVQQMGWPGPAPVLQAGTWAGVLLVSHSLWSSERQQALGSIRLASFYSKATEVPACSQGAERYVPSLPVGGVAEGGGGGAELGPSVPPATALIPGGWMVETSSTALPRCRQCGKAGGPLPPPQASWPCSESTQQAAPIIRENLSPVRCF